MMDHQPTPILSAPIRDSRPALNPNGSLQPNLSLHTECHTPVNLLPFFIQLTLSIVVNTLSTHGVCDTKKLERQTRITERRDFQSLVTNIMTLQEAQQWQGILGPGLAPAGPRPLDHLSSA